jgi:hypothetical protein
MTMWQDDIDRKLTRQLLTLSYVDRVRLVLELGLLTDDEKNVPDHEFAKNIIDRALGRGHLEYLWNALAIKHAELNALAENPFNKSSAPPEDKP